MLFNNKYIDYSSKSKRELYETLILFTLLSNKKIVSISKYLISFALFVKLPIISIIKYTVFKHFCGGEDINESKKTILQLQKNNIKTILDYSIEGKNNNQQIEYTYQEILKNLEKAKIEKYIPFCVFKITGIARFRLLEKINSGKNLNKIENKELLLLKKRLNNICIKARKCKTPILIDAEESWIQNGIDKLAEEMMSKFNKEKVLVYNTIQLYRNDKLKYIKQQQEIALRLNYKLGLKLVRGAYMEKERLRASQKNYTCPIHDSKHASDKDFDKATKYCIDNIDTISICLGTHNEKSTHYAIELMKKNNINNNDPRIYFSQLLGMSDNITFYLAHFNFNVAKYVPYGPVKDVIPYLFRRAEENSSVTGQTNREIKRIREIIKTNYN